MFSETDMEAMAGLRPSFATNNMFNPGKIFPTGSSCADVSQAAAILRAGPGAYI